MTLNKEATGANCETQSWTPKCSIDYVGPVTIPSVGVEAMF